MESIVLSINPAHVKKILDGEKLFEYRRKRASKPIKFIYIYETAPVKKVVAKAEVWDILEYPPDYLWEGTKEDSGISKEFFDEYFKGKEMAYAYMLGPVSVYDKPKELSDFGLKSAPQSYAYVRSDL